MTHMAPYHMCWSASTSWNTREHILLPTDPPIPSLYQGKWNLNGGPEEISSGISFTLLVVHSNTDLIHNSKGESIQPLNSVTISSGKLFPR